MHCDKAWLLSQVRGRSGTFRDQFVFKQLRSALRPFPVLRSAVRDCKEGCAVAEIDAQAHLLRQRFAERFEHCDGRIAASGGIDHEICRQLLAAFVMFEPDALAAPPFDVAAISRTRQRPRSVTFAHRSTRAASGALEPARTHQVRGPSHARSDGAKRPHSPNQRRRRRARIGAIPSRPSHRIGTGARRGGLC